jgi:uncharacterized HAD superfamily protein
MKISFDFDQTLDQIWVQKIAKSFQKSGSELFILTSRENDFLYREGLIVDHQNRNLDLIEIAKILEIPWEHIIYTNGEKKFKYLKKYGIDLHFDDDYKEIELINQNKGKGILINLNVSEILFELQNIDNLQEFLNKP